MDISKLLGAGGGAGGAQAGAYMANAMGGLGGLGGVSGGPKLGGGLPPMQRGGGQPGGSPGGFMGMAQGNPNGMTIEDVWGGGTNPSIGYRMGGMAALSPYNQQALMERMNQGAPQPPTGMNPNMTAPFFSAAQGGMSPQMGAGRPIGGFFSRMGR